MSTYEYKKQQRLKNNKCLGCGRTRDGRALRCQICKDKQLVRTKRSYERRLSELLDEHDNKCACCGETEPLFLTIDHKNNDGHLHKRTNMGGRGNLRDAHRGEFEVQILCWNCNCGRARNGGVCPHVIAKEGSTSK